MSFSLHEAGMGNFVYFARLNMARSLIFLILWCLPFIGLAQTPTVQVWMQGAGYRDSSFYDILPLSGGDCWVAGKYGILKKVTPDGKIDNVPYPTLGLDIYRLGAFDEDHLIACADKGVVYLHQPSTKNWNTVKVKGYEKSCFYSLKVVNKSTAFLCGGNSKIAHSQKAIPRGFILKSEDGGLTWKEVYRNVGQMVWDVAWDSERNSCTALVYSPNKTRLYRSDAQGENWKNEKKLGQGIFYQAGWNNGQLACTGGTLKGDGRIFEEGHDEIFRKVGLIWSAKKNGAKEVFTGSRSTLLLREGSNQPLQVFSTGLTKQYNLYRAHFLSDSKVLVVGSGKTMLLLEWPYPAEARQKP